MTTEKRRPDNSGSTKPTETAEAESPGDRESEITQEVPILKIDEQPDRKERQKPSYDPYDHPDPVE